MWPLIGALAVLGLSANEPTALLVVLVVLRSGRDRGVAFVAGLATATYPPAIVAAPVVGMYVSPSWAGRRSDAVFDWTLQHRRVLLTTILILVGSFVAVRAMVHLTHNVSQ